MKPESGLSKNTIIAELSKSPHGNLSEYVPLGRQAVKEQPAFFAHLIAWDRLKGQVRDAKVALPVVSLSVPEYAEEFKENSFAAISLLGPRELLRAWRFVLELRDKKEGKLPMTQLARILSLSLLEREKNWPRWERTMLQHRSVLKEVLALLHIKPRDQRTKACLYRSDKVDGKRIPLPYPEGGLFETVSRLKNMPSAEAAGTIMNKKIPFLIALGALGEKAKDTDLVLALIHSMTATELVTNTGMLERLGVKTNPALRGAFQEALEKAGKSKANLLKTTRAAENIDDEELKDTLRGLQEKQIQAHGGIEGKWLVLADKSPSMSRSVQIAKEVAGTLTKMVKDKVWLIFFDGVPVTVDVTGLTLDEIKKATRHIDAGGSGTSIGCGLQRMLDEKQEVDGIVVVSDGGENSTPYFAQTYEKYCKLFDKEPTVYFYHCTGDPDRFTGSMHEAKLDMQTFDLRSGNPDFYSLPNLVSTMRTNRYSLSDEILATRLLQLPDHFKHGTAKTATA